MGKNFVMLAKTLYGLEDLLAEELRSLGASNVERGVRSVSFEGDSGFMYKANLCCRTAIKILKPIKSFNVFNEDQLYSRIYDIPWEDYMQSNGTLSCESTVFSNRFSHSKYIALKTKDAIVDRFRDRTGHRPDIDRYNASLHVDIHIDRGIATVSLNSSGPSLHKRGYRAALVTAPINEVLAAGIVLLTGWRGQTHFLDPMCGGGTLLIEAAMIAAGIPANINRSQFGFQLWPDYDVELFELIRQSALNRIKEPKVAIKGYDMDEEVVYKARQNVKAANLEEFIKVEKRDFFKSKKEQDGPLQLVFNPPYDERLGISSIADFYGKIGSTLKHSYPGSKAWMITAQLEGLKSVGLRPSKKIKLYNGKLDSRLVCYELYEGSKKKGRSRSTS